MNANVKITFVFTVQFLIRRLNLNTKMLININCYFLFELFGSFIFIAVFLGAFVFGIYLFKFSQDLKKKYISQK